MSSVICARCGRQPSIPYQPCPSNKEGQHHFLQALVVGQAPVVQAPVVSAPAPGPASSVPLTSQYQPLTHSILA